jgi:hypothetical protein
MLLEKLLLLLLFFFSFFFFFFPFPSHFSLPWGYRIYAANLFMNIYIVLPKFELYIVTYISALQPMFRVAYSIDNDMIVSFSFFTILLTH